MDLGNKIKSLRLERKLTQEELAKKARISRVAVGNYERGDRIPNAKILQQIATALDVELYELLSFEEQRNIDLSNRIEGIIHRFPHHKVQILDIKAEVDSLIWDEFNNFGNKKNTDMIHKTIDNKLNLYIKLLETIRYFSNLQFAFDKDNAVKEKDFFKLYKEKDEQIRRITSILDDIYQNSLKRYVLEE